ncbi:hypothetical protein FH972_021377 [Carpinus fangiana]|uniref:Cytochrome P450 n=1 Tax=Carpinus fangiana TaxID=176857 RepID=A0A5N6KPI6_9ROSI|nr:hypothetical protein FH972_021377 [Carpinus fangiana]
MAKLRDLLVYILAVSAVEGYGVIHFAPQLRPAGGLGRLGFRLFLINVALLATYRWLIYPFFLSPLRKLPGPKGGNLFLGHGMLQFSKPPGDHLRKWVNSIPNDGLLRFRGFFNQDILIPTTHETLKQVLSDHTYDYVKPSQFVTLLRRILGDGLILVEGNVHKFQRKHLLPSFQLKVIKDLYPMFWSKSCALTTMLAPSEKENADPRGFEVEFGEWCMRATLDIIGIAGLGRDFNSLKNPDDEIVAQYAEVLEPSQEKLTWFALNIVFPQWIIGLIPWSINTKINAIQKNLYNFALGMVKERRQKQAAEKGNKDADILSLLVESNDFTDQELAHQVLTMMAAGHETTSSALSWTTYLLSKYPDIQRKCREEVRAALPSPDSGKTINAAQIDSLPILNAICNETTRLYPTVPVTIRETIRPTELAGNILPTGTTVLLVPWAINRSHHFWGEDAADFKPERWINEDGTPNNTGGSSSNYAQLTFLHGPRSCIGQGFAKSELKCLLAAIVGRYEFELSKEGDTYFPAGLVTTKPQGGMWLRMKRIEGW